MPRIYFSDLDILKGEIEDKLNLSGQKIGYIAQKVSEYNGVVVSVPNLDRIWRDYTVSKDANGVKNLTDNTINDLVKILGYENWGNYKHYLNSKIIGKSPINTFYDINIDISRLRSGDEITIGYTKKYAKLRYIDGFEFEVLENHNTHKKKGERFITPGFSVKISASGEPDIMLDDYGEGYFDFQREEYGEVFDDDYFYL